MAGTMTPETRGRLRQYAAEKRNANPKPKDYSAEHWTVACDFALESSHADMRSVDGDRCYLKYVPADFVEILATWLPWEWVEVWNYSGFRKAKSFEIHHGLAVMKFLGLNAERYLKRHRPNSK